ncbi:hypothetical protein V6N13_140213 [Hibiscus sabdariffa]|uniref:Uncharacterized protein n=1 Tax=Hibiscus sabdariffa TaxID=183260 RepID=A0ABR2QAV6_9ROSI
MEKSSETKEKNEEATAEFAVWDCGSPLYDTYELVSLSHLIERHLMKLPYHGGSKRLTSTTTTTTTGFSSPDDVSVTPAAVADTPRSNARAKESSPLMSSLGEWLGSKFWKRIRFGHKRNKLKRSKTFI